MFYVKTFQLSNYGGYFSGKLFGNLQRKNSESSYFCVDCDHVECNPGSPRTVRRIEVDSSIKYKFNNFSYRCDNFTDNIGLDNFYFSGCSNTLGVGLPYESTWAYQLNKTLGGKDYINLGINGGSASQIVYDAYRFIENFGKPKAIFLLFPNLERYPFFTQQQHGAELVNTHWNNGSEAALNDVLKTTNPYDSSVFAFYNLVYSFELYCKALDIPLFWTCWDQALRRIITEYDLLINNYVNLEDYEHIILDENIPEGFSEKYRDEARDHVHFGTKFHYWVYSSMLDKYLGVSENDKNITKNEEDIKKISMFRKSLKKKGGIY
jgi:hypothetical protein